MPCTYEYTLGDSIGFFKVNNSRSELFPDPIAASIFVKFKRNLLERERDILG